LFGILASFWFAYSLQFDLLKTVQTYTVFACVTYVIFAVLGYLRLRSN